MGWLRVDLTCPCGGEFEANDDLPGTGQLVQRSKLRCRKCKRRRVATVTVREARAKEQ